jgi:ABC-type Fe3+ transport system substrate-binding protein
VFPDQKAFGTLVIPAALVLIQNGPNPEQGKRFIDFLLRSDMQKLLGENQVVPSLDKIKPMEVDFSKLESESKELSRGFLSRWVRRQK